jgi:hypothetical protein
LGLEALRGGLRFETFKTDVPQVVFPVGNNSQLLSL